MADFTKEQLIAARDRAYKVLTDPKFRDAPDAIKENAKALYDKTRMSLLLTEALEIKRAGDKASKRT